MQCITGRACTAQWQDGARLFSPPVGEGLRTIELSLDDLKTKFRGHTVSATMQCTGNRRHEINEVRPVQVCFGQ